MQFDVELEDILPKFVTLPKFYDQLKNWKMLFNRPLSFLYLILTKSKNADLMDIERLAKTSIVMLNKLKLSIFTR
jgi:hypothetical protein